MTFRAARRPQLFRVLLVGFLVLQVAVPVVALSGPRPARFAWQMYSALPPVPQAWALDGQGEETAIDVGALFAVQRAELDYPRILREGLCDATDAVAVRIVVPGEMAGETLTCP